MNLRINAWLIFAHIGKLFNNKKNKAEKWQNFYFDRIFFMFFVICACFLLIYLFSFFRQFFCANWGLISSFSGLRGISRTYTHLFYTHYLNNIPKSIIRYFKHINEFRITLIRVNKHFINGFIGKYFHRNILNVPFVTTNHQISNRHYVSMHHDLMFYWK